MTDLYPHRSGLVQSDHGLVMTVSFVVFVFRACFFVLGATAAAPSGAGDTPIKVLLESVHKLGHVVVGDSSRRSGVGCEHGGCGCETRHRFHADAIVVPPLGGILATAGGLPVAVVQTPVDSAHGGGVVGS